jgi:transposase
MECRDAPPNDLSRSLVALDQNSTIIAVVELSQSSWLVGGVVPGIERQPHKKLEPSPERLLAVLHRWRDEAVKAGRNITRIALAFEAGRDGFWLARWLEARGVEAHVIHPSSVAVSREHRRAKTDRLDTALLKRAFLGWLRGERGHCSMARIPTIAEEDAKRPHRERECLVRERTRIVNRMKGTLARLGIRDFRPTLRKSAQRLATLHTPEGSLLPPNVSAELQRDVARLGFVVSQIKEIEKARQRRLEQQSESGPHAMVRRLARVVGIGIETADMLVHEVLSRPMRDRKAVARYAGLTGSPDESGAKRREQGLARAGNARVRRSMIQLASGEATKSAAADYAWRTLAAHQLDPFRVFCRACHSIEPGAGLGWGGLRFALLRGRDRLGVLARDFIGGIALHWGIEHFQGPAARGR